MGLWRLCTKGFTELSELPWRKQRRYSKHRELDSKSIIDQVKFNLMQTTKAELKTRQFEVGKKVQAYLHATVSRIIVTSFTALFHSTAKDTH